MFGIKLREMIVEVLRCEKNHSKLRVNQKLRNVPRCKKKFQFQENAITSDSEHAGFREREREREEMYQSAVTFF